jgi:hypothetical protein
MKKKIIYIITFIFFGLAICITLLFCSKEIMFWNDDLAPVEPASKGISTTEEDPLIDGEFSTQEEYAAADTVEITTSPDEGTWYYQIRENWSATSSSNNTETIDRFSVFVIHDIWNAQSQDESDYNTFDFNYYDDVDESYHLLTVWIFAGGNYADENDSDWIGNSGIGRASIDDRGFLVRKDNNSNTDVQWFPGNPEPGDPTWDGENYYYIFAKAGFNNSAYTEGFRQSPSDANEVYECVMTERGRNGFKSRKENDSTEVRNPTPTPGATSAPTSSTIPWDMLIDLSDPKGGDPEKSQSPRGSANFTYPTPAP